MWQPSCGAQPPRLATADYSLPHPTLGMWHISPHDSLATLAAFFKPLLRLPDWGTGEMATPQLPLRATRGRPLIELVEKLTGKAMPGKVWGRGLVFIHKAHP